MIIKCSEKDHDEVDNDHKHSLAASLFADDNHNHATQGVMVLHSSYCCSSDKEYKRKQPSVFFPIITPNPQNPHTKASTN